MFKITKTMLTEEQIKAKVAELGKQIEKDFEGQDLLVVGILKGASVFVADLIRNINLDVNMDFMSVSSYGNAMESSGSVKILKDLDVDIKDKNVLIVEDIIDCISAKSIVTVLPPFIAAIIAALSEKLTLDPNKKVTHCSSGKYLITETVLLSVTLDTLYMFP